MTPRPRRSMATSAALWSRVAGARPPRVAAAGALVLALVLTGCNTALESEPQTQPSAADDTAGNAAEKASDSTAEPPGGSRRSQATTARGALTMLSEVVGSGAPVDEATCVALDVDLEVADDHTPVPSPSETGPLVVARDDQRLIPGLRAGIEGMAVDGHRTMLIPPALAYGDAGWGKGLVGPDDTLRADVSVLWAGRRPSWTWPELHRAASIGGGALDIEPGSGAPFATGATGVVMIDAIDLDADSPVASMWDGCDAHALDLSSKELMGWFLDALEGLRPGGTRLVLHPDGVTDNRGVNAWVVTLAWTQG